MNKLPPSYSRYLNIIEKRKIYNKCMIESIPPTKFHSNNQARAIYSGSSKPTKSIQTKNKDQNNTDTKDQDNLFSQRKPISKAKSILSHKLYLFDDVKKLSQFNNDDSIYDIKPPSTPRRRRQFNIAPIHPPPVENTSYRKQNNIETDFQPELKQISSYPNNLNTNFNDPYQNTGLEIETKPNDTKYNYLTKRTTTTNTKVQNQSSEETLNLPVSKKTSRTLLRPNTNILNTPFDSNKIRNPFINAEKFGYQYPKPIVEPTNQDDDYQSIYSNSESSYEQQWNPKKLNQENETTKSPRFKGISYAKNETSVVSGGIVEDPKDKFYSYE